MYSSKYIARTRSSVWSDPVFLNSIFEHDPQVARLVHFTCGRPSNLFFGRYTLQSASKTHQGDPLAMHLEALAIHPFLRQLHRSFPHAAMQAWYADDGNIILPSRDAPRLLITIARDGCRFGMFINIQKTGAWWFGKDHFQRLPCKVVTSEATKHPRVTNWNRPRLHRSSRRATTGS